MTIMLGLGKRLSQWICNIVICGYSAYLNISSINDLSNEMVTPEHVFRSLVWSWFLSLCNGPIIVTIEIYWICNARNNSQSTNELLDPNCFLSYIWYCYILSLCCRICNCVLFGTLPADTSIQTKYITKLRSKMIWIRLETGIYVTFHNKIIFLSSIG